MNNNTYQQLRERVKTIVSTLNRCGIEQHTIFWRDCGGSLDFAEIKEGRPIAELTNVEIHEFGATAVDIVLFSPLGFFEPVPVGVRHLFIRSCCDTDPGISLCQNLGHGWKLIWTLQFFLVDQRKGLVFDII